MNLNSNFTYSTPRNSTITISYQDSSIPGMEIPGTGKRLSVSEKINGQKVIERQVNIDGGVIFTGFELKPGYAHNKIEGQGDLTDNKFVLTNSVIDKNVVDTLVGIHKDIILFNDAEKYVKSTETQKDDKALSDSKKFLQAVLDQLGVKIAVIRDGNKISQRVSVSKSEYVGVIRNKVRAKQIPSSKITEVKPSKDFRSKTLINHNNSI